MIARINSWYKHLKFLYQFRNPVRDFFAERRHRKWLKGDLRAQASLAMWDMIPEEQRKQVFKGTAWAEIEPECLTCGNLTYKYLAEIIPEEWTVVDLGCSYNAQSFLFQNHARHIAVDFGKDYSYIDEDGEAQCTGEHWKVFRFMAPACEFHEMTIREFIESDLYKALDLATTFAICNYVPPWFDDNIKLVREAFPNCYTFYPASVKKKCDACGQMISIDRKNGISTFEYHSEKNSGTYQECANSRKQWNPVNLQQTKENP